MHINAEYATTVISRKSGMIHRALVATWAVNRHVHYPFRHELVRKYLLRYGSPPIKELD